MSSGYIGRITSFIQNVIADYVKYEGITRTAENDWWNKKRWKDELD